MIEFKNNKKDQFLRSFPDASLELDSDRLTERCKFNFSYMDFSQNAGQKFEDWTKDQLTKLLNKLFEYSKEKLGYWQAKPIGKGSNKVLEVYGKFPLNSDFIHPKHVPHQALWARFRLESSVRLIGFIVPQEYENKKHQMTKQYYDCNTFYVVFLDENHRFYITKRGK